MLPSYDFILEDDSVIQVGRLELGPSAKPRPHTGFCELFRREHATAFSGDTLFPGGPGATNSEGGDFDTIIKSIEDRMFSKFTADTLVLPGHGDDTTIGNESPQLRGVD